LNGSQTPHQEPGTEKRLLIAFVLTFVVLVLMQPLLKKYGPKEQPAPQQTKSAPATPGAAVSPSTPGQPQPTTPPAAPAQVLPAKQGAAEQETVVENDLYRIVFTNRGAQVKSWVLKKFNDDKGNPLELVNTVAAPQYGYPMSLWTYDSALRKTLNESLYVPSLTESAHAPATLSFEYVANGLVVRKVFNFDHSYVVKLDTFVQKDGAAVRVLPAWPAGFGDQTVSSSYASAKVAYQTGGKVERVDPKKVSGGNTVQGPLHWAGVEDQYFAAVFLPDEPENAVMVTLAEQIEIPKNLDKPDPTQMQKVPVLGAAVGDVNGLTRERLFVGPKKVDVLDSVHASLTRAERASLGAGAQGPDLGGLVDFGKFFGWIAKPLFLWLKWTNTHMAPNWGWDIVILTVIITAATMPLRISSMKSSLKMQKVQPQIKAIQEKYKKYKVSDPRRADMNKEVADIYKREGINPVGGCIPMLLQMPFLIAFYSMLGVAIELRHAHWLWLRDLSSPDPYHILPVLIIVTMFFVQKITPSGGMDPVQQKMMQVMMPLFIGAISWSLSAGLGIYWALSNLIAIVQQVWVNNTAFGREMREHMEKQARKKAGK
jgi:YidC/Oxa1 family membrane protein insertase